MMHPETIVSKLEAVSALDEPFGPPGEAVRRAIGTGVLKEALRASAGVHCGGSLTGRRPPALGASA
jgi:hypothetical protein